jgi:hypothetical protein
MKNIGTGDGILRGLILGTALALVLILGMNALGHWDQRHKAATPAVLLTPGC